jgi:multimeric flavodoxin WrbA
MTKALIISGSPRKGNTEFILNEIFQSFDGEKELILLRNKNIKHCTGCLFCDEHKKCAVQDDMQEIHEKILETDLIVLGTPNYFDNVPGLVKDFIDRTNPFYETDKLKDKRLITIVVGGGKIKNSKRVGEQALRYFYEAHQMKLVGGYYFQALHLKDAEKNPKIKNEIEKIVKKIKSLK